MTYEMFKEIVIQEIKGYLPPDWQNAKIGRIDFPKTNHIKDAITFEKGEDKEVGFTPNIGMKMWYERYQEGDTLEEVLSDIASQVLEAERDVAPFKEILSTQNMDDIIRENVCLKLINTKQNKELLEEMPHKEFNDLSVVCTWVMKEDIFLGSANISYGLLNKLQMSEEELFEQARENTKRVMKPVVMSMSEVMEQQYGIKLDELEETPSMMYVLSNEKNQFGATTVLFVEEVDKVAERAGEDLYLIPSSVHEFLAVPKSTVDLEHLQEIVYEINMSQVDIAERLSNEVYQYDRISRQVTLATDCPVKSLDTPTEETPHMMHVAEMAR